MVIEIRKSETDKYEFNEFTSYGEKLDHWLKLASNSIIFKFIFKEKEAYLFDYLEGKFKAASDKELRKIKRSLPIPNNQEDIIYFYNTFEHIVKSEIRLDEINSLTQIHEEEWYKKYVLRNIKFYTEENIKLKVLMMTDELKIIDILTRLKIGKEDRIFNQVYGFYKLEPDYESTLMKFQDSVYSAFVEIYNGIELAKYCILIEFELNKIKKLNRSIRAKPITKIVPFRELFESDEFFNNLLAALDFMGFISRDSDDMYVWDKKNPIFGVLGKVIRDDFKKEHINIKSCDLAQSMCVFFNKEYNASVEKKFQNAEVQGNLNRFIEFEFISNLKR